MNTKALYIAGKVIIVAGIICALVYFFTGKEHRLVLSGAFPCLAVSLVLRMIYDHQVRKQAKDSEDENDSK